MSKFSTLVCAAAILFLPCISWSQENVDENLNQVSQPSEVQVPDAASPSHGSAHKSAVSGSSGHTIKQSFFGADFNGFGTWPPTDGQHQVATLGSIRLWDDNVKWADINTASGKYDWSELDTWISKAQAQGVDVLYTFGDTPKWAGSIPKNSPCTDGQGSYSCSAPKDVNSDGTGSDNDFSNFVTALVKRYKGQIAYY